MGEALLYTQSAAIVGIDLEPPNSNNYMPVITSKMEQNISALDVDTRAAVVYWTDLRSKSIFRAQLNDSEPQIVINIGTNIDFISEISVELIAKF